jgi:serine protease Do
MRKIGLTVFAAFFGGAVAIGAYKLLERNTDAYSLAEKQEMMFASNPIKIASSGSVDFVQAAAAVSPAVVHIKTTYSGKSSGESQGNSMEDFFDLFGGGGRRSNIPRAASGSGVILTADGYIATNNHVVDNADKIEVILSNKRKVTAKIIGKDPNTDLALLKVDVTGLPFVKMGNSDNVQIGEWVLAVGFPLDLQTTVTAGIVSAKTRSIGIIGSDQNRPTREEIEEYERTGKMPERTGNTAIEAFIQTDAAINPGNSGGALVNANGELIGINSAIASETGRNVGYGFAIPVNLAKKILEDFKEFGTVKRGYLGVSFPNPRNEEEVLAEKGLDPSKVQGVYVLDVVAGGAAQAAGVKAGDIIKKMDGVRVYDSPDLQEKIGRRRPGDRVALTLQRADGSSKDLTVTLKGENPVALASKKVTEKAAGASVSQLGASFAPASSTLKERYKINSGVVVTYVEPGKLFDYFDVNKGLLITTINGKPVNNTSDVEKALASGNGKTTIAGFGESGAYTFSFKNAN